MAVRQLLQDPAFPAVYHEAVLSIRTINCALINPGTVFTPVIFTQEAANFVSTSVNAVTNGVGVFRGVLTVQQGAGALGYVFDSNYNPAARPPPEAPVTSILALTDAQVATPAPFTTTQDSYVLLRFIQNFAVGVNISQAISPHAFIATAAAPAVPIGDSYFAGDHTVAAGPTAPLRIVRSHLFGPLPAGTYQGGYSAAVPGAGNPWGAGGSATMTVSVFY